MLHRHRSGDTTWLGRAQGPCQTSFVIDQTAKNVDLSSGH